MTLGWGPVRPSPSSFNLEERGEQWGRSTQISGQTYSEEISVLARAEETIIKRSQVVAAMLGPVDDWRLEEGSSLGLPVPDLRTACPDVRHRHGGGGTGTTHVNPWRHKDMRGQYGHTNTLPGPPPSPPSLSFSWELLNQMLMSVVRPTDQITQHNPSLLSNGGKGNRAEHFYRNGML